MKAWNSVRPSAELQATIIADIKKRLDNGTWDKDESQFIPHAATYLRGARWEDEQSSGTTEYIPPVYGVEETMRRAMDNSEPEGLKPIGGW